MIIESNSNFSGIYKITNSVNGKFYVGSAVNFARRKNEHIRNLKAGTHHSKRLQAAFNKYGESAFDFNIICIVENKDALIHSEQIYLDMLCNVKSSYNTCKVAGSTAGVLASEETKAKMRKSREFTSEETRIKRSLALKGRKKSEEWKALMSLKMTGRKLTDEQKKTLSQSALNRSQEAKDNIARAIRESDIKNGGRHSDESKSKISKALTGRKLSAEHREAVRLSWVKRKLLKVKE